VWASLCLSGVLAGPTVGCTDADSPHSHTCTVHVCTLLPCPQCPNLRCVMSLGAGVDTLMIPGLIPHHLPIARIVSVSAFGL
jgi:hypothetical protein